MRVAQPPPDAMSLFAAIEMAPRDPILGLNEQFNADAREAKVNLGVGVYYDDEGKLPLLQCVREAEARIAEAPRPRGYLPIDGIAAYDKAVQGTGVRCRHIGAEGRPHRHRAGARRHRRPEDRRRLPAPHRQQDVGADQRSQLGEPPRAVLERRFRRRRLSLLRRRAARHRFRCHVGCAAASRRRHDGGAARLLPQSDRL